MRPLAASLVAGSLLAGCEAPPSFSDAERARVVREVAARMEQTLADLDAMRGAALDTVFLADPGVVNVEDTTMTVGAATLAGYFTAALAGAKSIDSTAFDSVLVYPFGVDAAVAVAKFREIITLADGTRVFDRGVWSSTFRRTPAGWKMVTAHVSHAPAPPPVRP